MCVFLTKVGKTTTNRVHAGTFFVGADPRLDYKPPVVRLYSRGSRSLNVVTADTNRDPAPRLSLKSPWLSQFSQFP